MEIGKGYVTKLVNGVKRQFSPFTYTSTVKDQKSGHYLDTMLDDLKNYSGYPITTSLEVTEEGKYALDAAAGSKINQLCQEVFQSADSARNVMGAAIGIKDTSTYNLSTLSSGVKSKINEIRDCIIAQGGSCPVDPSLNDILLALQGSKILKHKRVKIPISYNEVANSRNVLGADTNYWIYLHENEIKNRTGVLLDGDIQRVCMFFMYDYTSSIRIYNSYDRYYAKYTDCPYTPHKVNSCLYNRESYNYSTSNSSYTYSSYALNTDTGVDDSPFDYSNDYFTFKIGVSVLNYVFNSEFPSANYSAADRKALKDQKNLYFTIDLWFY